jgi:hypothetical protein
MVHLGFPDLHTGTVHTSWNSLLIWTSILCEKLDPFAHQPQVGDRLERLVERSNIMDDPPEQAKEILDKLGWQMTECKI